MPKSRKADFQLLLDRNYGKWFGIARTYSSNSDCDDLMQEIFMQIWRSMPSFKGDAHIDTWGYRVALNTAMSWNRKSKRRGDVVGSETTDTAQVTGTATGQAESRILDEFIRTLSKTDRAVLLLYLDNLPQQEAASVVGLTEGAFRVRVHRLKKKFLDMYITQGDTK